jgi:proteasome lid subunit RPN8/RPN11
VTSGQKIAVEQLQEIEAAPKSPLEILSAKELEDGRVAIYVSVDCSNVPHNDVGMPLRGRERFKIYVPRDFPFSCPQLYTTHRRWENYPHVYWATYLCLYQASDTEWNPSDGMFGFVGRIDLFLRKAATGQLDPIGAPMHPPTTPNSGRNDLPTIVPKADSPSVEGQPWFGFAVTQQVSDRRIDILSWASVFAETWPQEPVAAALLLDRPMSHLFPNTIGKLIVELQSRGVNRNQLLAIIRCGLTLTAEDAPLVLIIGAPMRGISGSLTIKQHLTAWYLDADTAKALRLSMPRSTDNAELRQLRADLEDAIFTILAPSPIHWCNVLEARPEIIVRRDLGTPMQWFAGKAVAIWGCGAIGAQLAEAVTRAGVSRIVLYDSAIVKPGVLVRQPYGDRDIGFSKVEVLKRNLRRIRPDLTIESHVGDVKRLALERNDWHDNADIVLDATASRSVLTKLELKRKHDFQRVPLASFVIGPKAQRGMLIVAGAGHSGGPFDVARSAKLKLLQSHRSSSYIQDFFPVDSHVYFQPEPGCSEPTFVGSYSDVAALSHSMLNSVPEIVTSIHSSEAEARFFQYSASPTIRIQIRGRIVSVDPQTSFETRISDVAWDGMQEHVDHSAWKRGKRVETGGIILGEKDEILRVIWVDEMTKPPRDSTMSEAEFICGTEGTAALHAARDAESRGSLRYIGMWHTHPDSAPLPSGKDMRAMAQLSGETATTDAHTLMLIIGTPYRRLCLATYVFSRSEVVRGLLFRTCALSFPPSMLGTLGRRQTLRGKLLAWSRRLFTVAGGA